MQLHQITDFNELMGFLPILVRTHAELDGIWEPEKTKEEFVSTLTTEFKSTNYYFGAIENGKLAYFVVILRETDTKAFFWLFYMNKDYRLQTRQLLLDLKLLLHNLGFRRVELVTTRLTKSYNRWISKFGAQPVALTYRMEI